MFNILLIAAGILEYVLLGIQFKVTDVPLLNVYIISILVSRKISRIHTSEASWLRSRSWTHSSSSTSYKSPRLSSPVSSPWSPHRVARFVMVKLRLFRQQTWSKEISFYLSVRNLFVCLCIDLTWLLFPCFLASRRQDPSWSYYFFIDWPQAWQQ